MHVYSNSAKVLPPGALMWKASNAACGTPATGYVGWGWGTMILPQLEQGNLYAKIDFSKAYGPNYTNKDVTAQFVDIYLCPSDPQGRELVTCCGGQAGATADEDVARSNMAGVADHTEWTCDNSYPFALSKASGVMAALEGCSFEQVRDGTSQTLMIGEVTGGMRGSYRGHFWATWGLQDTGDGINAGTTTPSGGSGANLYTAGFSSYHPGGCMFAFVDGSVHFLSENISQTTLATLTTRAAGDILAEGIP
jgi:prepilin-type processing-associated H-X9-DG protein